MPNLRLVTIFINVPDNTRKDRALNKRQDDRLTFMKRDMAEREQFRTMLRNADFDYSITNLEWPKAYSMLRWLATIEGMFNHKEDTTE